MRERRIGKDMSMVLVEVHFMTEENKEIVVIDETTIRSKIYYIRNQKVMLDFELAEIYGYTTTRFNEQVKNNSEKFDDDFMFQLTKSEFENLISKKSTSSWGGRRKLPYAFTEQGIYMLMTVLRGELAVKQSKALIRMFKQMKDFIIENQDFISSNVRNKDMLTKNILDDFRKEYPNVDLNLKIAGKKYHDRYIAIDYGTENEAFYLCGASSKDAGNKISSITKIEESSKDMYHTMFGEMLNNKNLRI